MRVVEKTLCDFIADPIKMLHPRYISMTGSRRKFGSNMQMFWDTSSDPSSIAFMTVLLYDTNIMTWDSRSGTLRFTHGGYNTPTTRSRLNSLCDSLAERHILPFHLCFSSVSGDQYVSIPELLQASDAVVTPSTAKTLCPMPPAGSTFVINNVHSLWEPNEHAAAPQYQEALDSYLRAQRGETITVTQLRTSDSLRKPLSFDNMFVR